MGTRTKTKGRRKIKRQDKTEREKEKENKDLSHRISQDRSIDVFITSSTYMLNIQNNFDQDIRVQREKVECLVYLISRSVESVKV